MPHSLSITYYGMTGTGSTVKEAKADAGARIKQALKRSYNPTLVTWRGKVAVIMPSIDGYGYRIYDQNEMPIVLRTSACTQGYTDADDILRVLVFHLADITRVYLEPPECNWPLFEDAFGQRDREKHWQEYLRRCVVDDRFQCRYKFAISKGMENGLAHNFAAGQNFGEFAELQKQWEEQYGS